MLFTVVIPAHNASEYLDAQLDALAAQTYSDPFDVVVVDNLSTDDTAAVARRHAHELDLHVVDATQATSAPHARNVGVSHARGQFVVFVDADDVVNESLLDAYRRQVGSFRIMGGHLEDTRLNPPDVASWRYRPTVDGLPVAFGVMPFFMMGNVAIHRSVFDAIGPFDETLTHGGEEVDFSIRAQLAGYEIGWVPDAVIYYRHRTTLRELSRQFFNWGRATTMVYARYRNQATLPPTTLRRSAHAAWNVFPLVVNVARGSARRGDWVRVTSFYAGEVLESVRQGVWHVG